MTRGRVAVTGATGFLGRHLVRTLAGDGWDVRILARRETDGLWPGLAVEAVRGALDQPEALRRLCEGAAAVVHGAGLIKARTRAAFYAANAAGAGGVAEAARDVAPDAAFVLVSSLAAREPSLSDYAGSKREGEAAVRGVLGERFTIARPPAVYGPGDVETLALFKAAAKSPVLPVLSPAARIALIHVADAARQIATMAQGGLTGRTVTLSDARPEGYGWSDIMSAAAEAVGRPPRQVRVPGALIRGLALGAGLFGDPPMFTPGKARELLHPDWTVAPEERWADAPAPRFNLKTGFADTVNWYRQEGWL